MSDTYLIQVIEGNIDPVVAKRGTSPPKIVSGGGGWDIVPRPKRKGLTVWNGYDPTRMDVPILLDKWKDKDVVEREILLLNFMQLPPAPHVHPPRITIGPGVPVSGTDWVIESIEWGDNVIYDIGPGGRLVRFRQDATLHLLEFVSGTALVNQASPIHQQPASGSGSGSGSNTPQASAPRWYYGASKGESLYAIAVKFYHDRNKWNVIAAANGLRDSIVPRDMTLKIP